MSQQIFRLCQRSTAGQDVQNTLCCFRTHSTFLIFSRACSRFSVVEHLGWEELLIQFLYADEYMSWCRFPEMEPGKTVLLVHVLVLPNLNNYPCHLSSSTVAIASFCRALLRHLCTVLYIRSDEGLTLETSAPPFYLTVV